MTNLIDRDRVLDPIVTPNALTVLENRYLAKDNNGVTVEDPKGMYIRVATAIASAETEEGNQIYWADKFYNVMAQNEFMPNSPTLMNAGRKLGMLSACFVIPVEDDLSGIFDSIKAVAMTQRAGGGTGFNFSNLRPTNSIVKSSGGTTAGPLSFIDVFSQATNTIQQGAFRRGANMGILNITHPDIINFIKAKSDLRRWQNYNISIAVTDQWMEQFSIGKGIPHRVEHPEWGVGELYRNIKTDEVRAFKVPGDKATYSNGDWVTWSIDETWDLICTRAWTTGEPGLFFIDEANFGCPIPHVGRIESTNPCGEIPLHAWDSCNLGSINLGKIYTLNPNIPDHIDWDKFRDLITIGVRFLDNVITINKHPLPEMDEMSKKTRRIGLGIMGWADLLFKLKIPYDSQQARDLATRISRYLFDNAAYASHRLALIKGNYGAYEGSVHELQKTPMRNAYVTTVAPTGTISIIANCSGGIEPIFALAFKRTVMPDANGVFKEMYEENEHWLDALETSDLAKSEKPVVRERVKKDGSLTYFHKSGGAFDWIKDVFKTSHEIAPLDHVRMQAAWQTHIDSAISKTINLPHDADVSVVSKAYWEAYHSKCKGITVYRDGCRNNVEGMKQPMSVEKEVEPIEGGPSETWLAVTAIEEAKKNIDVYPSFRTQIKTQFGNLHVHIVQDGQGKEREIFAQLGKAGDLIAADLEAICRLASISLRTGSTIQEIVDQLQDIGTTHVMPTRDGKIISMPDALAKALRKYLDYREGNISDVFIKKEKTESNYGLKCPACPVGKLSFQEGCRKCHSCGFSAC